MAAKAGCRSSLNVALTRGGPLGTVASAAGSEDTKTVWAPATPLPLIAIADIRRAATIVRRSKVTGR
jgi:hypothetical protein